MRVLIIGGGIGGLAAAAALRKLNIPHHVFERAPRATEIGAGISMWPNAMKALAWLGLADAVRRRGLIATDAHIRSMNGRSITRADMLAIRDKLGAEFLMIHRAELLDALLEGVDPAAISWGKSLARVEQDDHAVTAHFDGGASERADLLIGADGLKSIVRAQAVDNTPPRPAGQTAYRGLVKFDHPAFPRGSVWEVWGPRARVGITCLPDSHIYWWATHDSLRMTSEANPDHRRDLLQVFTSASGWCEPIEAMLRATDPAHILKHDLFDRAPRRGWSNRRIVLLGDAAHPMTPNLGQGGCTAIEDGIVLARCIQALHAAPETQPNANGASLDAANIARALSRYERARFARTASLVRQSRFLGWWGQRPAAWQCRVRDAIFSVISPLTFERSMMQFGAYDAGQVSLP